MVTIKLRSSEGEVIDVDRKVAEFMLKDSNPLKEGQDVASIPNVNSVILRMIIKWTKHRIGDNQTQSDSDDDEDESNSFDEKFLNKQHPGTLLELTLAAKHLDIKGLLEATSKQVAKMLKGKTVEEIQQAFRMKKDLSAIEEKQRLMENKWCEPCEEH